MKVEKNDEWVVVQCTACGDTWAAFEEPHPGCHDEELVRVLEPGDPIYDNYKAIYVLRVREERARREDFRTGGSDTFDFLAE